MDKFLCDEFDLKDDNLGFQIVVYDLVSVKLVINVDRVVVICILGVWFLLLYLVFLKEIYCSLDKWVDMMVIVEMLVENGVDVNDGYLVELGFEYILLVFYGVLCYVDNLEFGIWLLEVGVILDDNECFYYSIEFGYLEVFKVLLVYNVNLVGMNVLVRVFDFCEKEKIWLFLEVGVNLDEVVLDYLLGQLVEMVFVFYQVVCCWCLLDIVELFFKYGVNFDCVWKGYIFYVMVWIFGNDVVVDLLMCYGVSIVLNEIEEKLVVCVYGVRLLVLLDNVNLLDEDQQLLIWIVFQEDCLEYLKVLVYVGFDFDLFDEMGLLLIYVVGWVGLLEVVVYFLIFSLDLMWKNVFGGDVFDMVFYGSEYCLDCEEWDYIFCVRLLFEVGSVIYLDFIIGCGNEEMVVFFEDWMVVYLVSLK